MSNVEFRTYQVMFPYSTIAPTIDLPGLSLEEFEGFYSMMSPGGNLPPSCTGGPMSYDYSYPPMSHSMSYSNSDKTPAEIFVEFDKGERTGRRRREGERVRVGWGAWGGVEGNLPRYASLWRVR